MAASCLPRMNIKIYSLINQFQQKAKIHSLPYITKHVKQGHKLLYTAEQGCLFIVAVSVCAMVSYRPWGRCYCCDVSYCPGGWRGPLGTGHDLTGGDAGRGVRGATGTPQYWPWLHSDLFNEEWNKLNVVLSAYAVVTPLRKATSYEQRKTNLWSSP